MHAGQLFCTIDFSRYGINWLGLTAMADMQTLEPATMDTAEVMDTMQQTPDLDQEILTRLLSKAKK